MSKELEILKKKILYRSSYRGTKEMDLLLGSFVKKFINKFDKKQLEALMIFLEFEDEVIFNYYNFNQSSENIEKNLISKTYSISNGTYNPEDIQIKFIGLREGEKLHEEIYVETINSSYSNKNTIDPPHLFFL